jgi:hypothetical protein
MAGGKGTPWGPTRYGQPSAVSLPEYQSDPNKYQSFDRSDLANRAVAQSQAEAANAMNQAKYRLAAQGGGRSSGANVQQMDLSNAAANRVADIRNQNALQSWQDKLGQMMAENQFNLGKGQLAMDKFKTEAGLSEAERQNRRQALDALGPLGSIANIFANY